MSMSYKATLDNIERRLAESKRKLAESCAPNPFIPEGYCPLATAVDRAAAAYFPQAYDATEISPQQRDRLARHHWAIEDITRLDAWERDAERRRSEAERRRKHAENARRASAGNVNSAPRRASGPNDPFGGLSYSNKGYADIIDSFDQAMGISRTVTEHSDETSLPARPMSEDQENAARLDAIEDDEVISTRQRTERQEALKDAAWKRLRQHLHRGRLVGFVQGNDGGHPKKIEASKWSARRFENAHKQDAFSNTLVSEDELAALLAGDQPQARMDTGHEKSDQGCRADSLQERGPDVVQAGKKPLVQGKRPRVLAYFRMNFPDGVPDPGHEPREFLRRKIEGADPSLKGFSEDTLQRAIKDYHCELGQRGQ
jgi:hypothetical protein